VHEEGHAHEVVVGVVGQTAELNGVL
jgi:hypothetical protein